MLTYIRSWHHDISPDNILVVSRNADSSYECDFKVADLGLSHFRRHSSSLGDASDEDKYGSNAYGELAALCCKTNAADLSQVHRRHIVAQTRSNLRNRIFKCHRALIFGQWAAFLVKLSLGSQKAGRNCGSTGGVGWKKLARHSQKMKIAFTAMEKCWTQSTNYTTS
jgi:hypothetical protein